MKKKIVIVVSTLASSIASAGYVAQIKWKENNYLIDGVGYTESSTAPPIVLLPCQGAELTRAELDLAIDNGDDVTRACVGTITDFSNLLNGHSSFAQDISNWDVSSGINFSGMFNGNSAFNQNLQGWDISSGTNFSNMFKQTTMATTSNLSGMTFNGEATGMFSNASVDGDLSGIKLLGDFEKSNIFRFSSINASANLDNWEISGNLTNAVRSVLSYSNIHGSLNNWNINNISYAIGFMKDSTFETGSTANNWSISNIPDARDFATNMVMEGNMDNWAITNVTDMNRFFSGADFIGGSTANGLTLTGNTETEIDEFLSGVVSNGEMSNWTINTFKNANYMVSGFVIQSSGKAIGWSMNGNSLNASALQAGAGLNFHSGSEVAGWTIQGLGDTTEFFASAIINSDITDWDLSDFTIYDGMFKNATFNQDISGWDVSNATSSVDFKGGTSNLDDANSPFN